VPFSCSWGSRLSCTNLTRPAAFRSEVCTSFASSMLMSGLAASIAACFENQNAVLTSMLATSKTASCLAVVEPRTESDQRKVRLVPSLLAWAVSPGCSSKPRASDMYSRSAVSSWSWVW